MPRSHPATDLALLTFLHIFFRKRVGKVVVYWALLAKGKNGQADEMSINNLSCTCMYEKHVSSPYCVFKIA
jgi:hypothetical protein